MWHRHAAMELVEPVFSFWISSNAEAATELILSWTQSPQLSATPVFTWGGLALSRHKLAQS